MAILKRTHRVWTCHRVIILVHLDVPTWISITEIEPLNCITGARHGWDWWGLEVNPPPRGPHTHFASNATPKICTELVKKLSNHRVQSVISYRTKLLPAVKVHQNLKILTSHFRSRYWGGADLTLSHKFITPIQAHCKNSGIASVY